VLRVNRETDYAIGTIISLAEYSPNEIVPSARIREQMEVPKSLSLQIISRLVKPQIIHTYPGGNGGIQLAPAPSRISLLDVIKAMEGPLSLASCLDNNQECSLAPGCTVQRYWIGLQARIEEDLASINFQELLKNKLPTPSSDVQ
jgi:Rrf2 family protein